ncbi:thioredoxin family protein [Myxococcota bacterium]
MGLIEDKDREQLSKVFADLKNPVKILYFTQEHECEMCRMTRELLEEVAGLSDKIAIEVHDFIADRALAEQYRVDKIPATVLMGDKDYGIRFYGIPAGYEFTTLIEDIVDVARRDPRLPEDVKAELAKVDQPVHLQVLISPTCPYCPTAVRTAHRFAMASDHITADMVETSEFPHLAVKYDVQGVPHTVINEEYSVIGPQKEIDFAKGVLVAIGKAKWEGGHDHDHEHE